MIKERDILSFFLARGYLNKRTSGAAAARGRGQPPTLSAAAGTLPPLFVRDRRSYSEHGLSARATRRATY